LEHTTTESKEGVNKDKARRRKGKAKKKRPCGGGEDSLKPVSPRNEGGGGGGRTRKATHGAHGGRLVRVQGGIRRLSTPVSVTVGSQTGP